MTTGKQDNPKGTQPATPATMRGRLWYAYHCQPRGRSGQLPSMISIERRAGLSVATIRKLLASEERCSRVEQRTLDRLAIGLSVSPEWLARGEGAGPALTGAYEPLPGEAVATSSVDASCPARARAVAYARAAGYSESSIRAVLNERAREYTELEWMARVILAAAHERLGG